MLIALALWCVLAARAFRTTRRRRSDTPSTATRALAAGAFLWGIAYLITGLDSHDAAARFLALDLTGSVVPIAALLEWGAIACVLVAVIAFVQIRLPPRLHNPALVPAAIAVTLVVAEGALRIHTIVAPQVQSFPTSSQRLWLRRWVHVNSLGFRDAEHGLHAAPSARRLLVIGDSFAFGIGIDDVAGRFGEQATVRFAERSGVKWESLNASRPDTHTLDHIGFLERMLPFEPDLVVLVYVFNDVDYLSAVTPRPTVQRREGIFRFHPARILVINSYLAQEVYVRLHGFLARETNDHDPYEDEDIMRAHIADLERFVSIAEESEVPAVIVPFDNAVGVGPSMEARYDGFAKRLAAAGLPVCRIDHAFRRENPRDLRVNALDGHPNARSNGIAVDAASDCLLSHAGHRPATDRGPGPGRAAGHAIASGAGVRRVVAAGVTPVH